jgi:hypothetical protein
MIYHHRAGNFTVTVADHMTDDFEFLMQGAKSEKATEYSNLELGGKYEYSVVMAYNSMPYCFFAMCNGGRYAPGVLRYLTKLYTIPQFRSGEFARFLLPGDTVSSTTKQSHSIVANFVEDVIPYAGIKPYDFYFYSRKPNDTPLVTFINKYARVPWTAIDDRVFLTGKKESDSFSWKRIIYKGDISKFTQPSRPI